MATILIVDDHPTNRDVLLTLLGYGGHRLLEATDGAAALKLVRAERPDLVIADIIMPTMDGYEFVHQLRADPAVAATTVIFSTAYYYEQEAHALAHACGVVHILTKPCEPEIVLHTVDVALGRRPALAMAPSETFDRQHLRVLTDKLSQKVDELTGLNLKMSTLLDISQRLALQRDPVRLLEDYCREARALLGAQWAAVGMLDEAGQSLCHFSTCGLDLATTAGLYPPPAPQGMLAALLRERGVRRLGGIDGNPHAIGWPPHYPPVHTFLGTAIFSSARVYGYLCFMDKLGADTFSTDDERIAMALAAQLAVAYENAQQYAEIQHYVSELRQEIVERQRAEEALQHANERYRSMVNNAVYGLYRCSAAGTFLDVNPALVAMLGYPSAEALMKIDMATDLCRDPNAHQHVNAQFRQAGAWEGVEVEWKRLDGTPITVRLSGRVVQDAQGAEIFEVIAEDATERQAVEAQLRQAQKLESIGRLVGGVAHNFNNLMMATIGYADLLLRDLAPGSPLRTKVEVIKNAGERAATLTHQLLAFGRKQMLQPITLDLNTVIAERLQMLRRLIGEDIALLPVLSPALQQVHTDPEQLRQVMVHLAINARDAMPQGGQLTIETTNVYLDADEARPHVSLRPGPYVMLTVRDTGAGMDAATLTHIFEPFFTTKPQEQGQGLGLSTVYGIVEQSGGHIRVFSVPGQGTTFNIYLPAVVEAEV
jgi:PAS domain S-box-containing protein